MKKDTHIKGEKKGKASLIVSSKIRVILFCLLLLTFFGIGIYLPIRPVESVIEKRKLAEFPKPTLENVWDGSWFTDLSTWYTDTYPTRETMISMQTQFETLYGIRETAIYGDTSAQGDEIPDENEGKIEAAPLLTEIIEEDEGADGEGESSSSETVLEGKQDGSTPEEKEEKGQEIETGKSEKVEKISEETTGEKAEEKDKEVKNEDGGVKVQPEVAGTVYVAENRGFTLYYFYQKGADTYASMLNTVAKKLAGIATVYDIVVPNSFGVNLDEEIQEAMNTSNQGKAIQYIYNRLDKSIKTVETYQNLRSHNSEYLYFKTDHHWTALGAYYVYRALCEVKGVEPHDLSEFEKKEFPDFIGTFYAYSNQSPALAGNPDVVEAYIPKGTNTEKIHPRKGEPYDFPIISDATSMSKANKYLAFIGGDQPLIEIKNPQIKDGSACILIKESYGNAFAPFLVDHYENYYIVDYRHFKGNVVDLAKKHKNTDVIFLNNTAATSVNKSKLMLGIFK